VAAGHEVSAPDYRGLDLATAADILMYQILDEPQQAQILVGHSFGGAVAFLASLQAARKGATVAALVLCAPALFAAQALMAPARLPCPVAPTILVHGAHDKVIPIDLSRGFAREHDLSLVEVDDGHRLLQSMGTILEAFTTITKPPSG
jgi:pimeloyl-ACP methyl ester carboxylesterase